MYKPIQLEEHRKSSNVSLECVNLDIFEEKKDEPSIFTEAVFANGKEKLAPLIPIITSIKEELMTRSKRKEEFDPKEFWRLPIFKTFEDTLKNIFGFRFVSIEPYIEKYLGNGEFESKELNCMVYRANRFPIDGIVTDNGFYDNSHSLVMNVYITLGLIYALESEEILAVFLHEFGHGIDPAIMNISYAECNILSKYITDRNEECSEAENQVIDKKYKLISKFLNVFKFKK